MNIELVEYGGCFSFEMKAESREDAAKLVRLALNGTKEIRYLNTHVTKDGNFISSLTLGKHKKASDSVRRG